MEKFDLIVIGTGPSASTVAKKSAEDGKRIVVIESRAFGGTCALRGCNPKKVYTNAGDLIERVRAGEKKLGKFESPQIDWSQLLAFKREFVELLPEKVENSLNKKGIETILGEPQFLARQQIEVSGRKLEADRIFIGCGARPVPLNIEGSEYVTLSDQFMELDSIPEHVTFIGGGYISMEFAHVIARYGSKVTIIDRNQRPLKQFEPELVAMLTSHSSSIGIHIITQAAVTSVRKDNSDFLEVEFEKNGEQQKIKTGLVVHGAGRKPNLANLHLEKAEVKYGDNGITVDKFMRSTSNSSVFAAGDCADSGMPRLTPVANEEARSVAKNIFSDSPTMMPDYGALPSVVFTSPCIASVGLSEAAAKENKIDIKIQLKDTSDWVSVKKLGLTCAGYKILIDKSNDSIVGAHLLGPAAEECINLFALAMKFNLKAHDLKSTLFAYPTFSSDIRMML